MIDKTAIIHPSAKIADDAIIGPYVVIGENVTIGHRTRVISNAHIEFAEIGDDCTISPFATIGSEPQDLGYKGEPTKVVIGDGTIIKENVTVHRGAACGDFTTRIGKKCLLMVGSHVAHNCVLADEVILRICRRNERIPSEYKNRRYGNYKRFFSIASGYSALLKRRRQTPCPARFECNCDETQRSFSRNKNSHKRSFQTVDFRRIQHNSGNRKD